MSEVKVNKISPRSGTTLQLGDSGDTITIPSGATLSASKVSGVQAVSWQTGSIKTSTFTAAAGEGYFVDTSSGAVTVNLPAGSAGATVAFADYTRTFGSNKLTINPNGSEKIGGRAQDAQLDVDGQSATFVFVDATEGWINVQETQTSIQGVNPFIVATGGTITTSGNFKIHTFTGPGTFTVTCGGTACGSNTVDYLVIAGGGAGGTSCSPRAGGGGAGGYRFSNGTASGCYTAGPSPLGASALPITAQAYPITVGGGGAGQTQSSEPGANGNPSVFSTITSTGGGGGGAGSRTFGDSRLNGSPGGSGGGSGGSENTDSDPINGGTIGSGNTPPVTPPQGNNGGQGVHAPGAWAAGGGGGGAGAVGQSTQPKTSPGPSSFAGDGGNGLTSCITASPVARGGGGGGTGIVTGSDASTGGTGGGGNGTCGSAGAGGAGTANTGGGGGAGPDPAGSGAGGSGIVIIRYKFQ